MQHHVVRVTTSFAQNVFGAAFRLVLTSIVFTSCVVVILRSMGVPMPSAHELLRQVEGLTGLSRIIS